MPPKGVAAESASQKGRRDPLDEAYARIWRKIAEELDSRPSPSPDSERPPHKLRRQNAALHQKMCAFAKKAAEQKRALTADEEAEWDRMVTEFEARRSAIQKQEWLRGADQRRPMRGGQHWTRSAELRAIEDYRLWLRSHDPFITGLLLTFA